MPLLSLITFLSAFLMFQLELIIAKLFLPQYGGSYMVWGACMVFFQAVLLAGYAFVNFTIERYGFNKYRLSHLILVALPLFFFPGRELYIESSASHLPLAITIFIQLILTIGPVFFTLSTTGVATQMWLSHSTLKEKINPYPLYAISNIGSFAGLLTYPFIFEYLFNLSEQLFIWRILYFILLTLTLWAFLSIKITAPENQPSTPTAFPAKEQTVLWFILGAAGVIIFLSVNNIITAEIAPVPLLWVVPLSLYLLSFVLNFSRKPWHPKWMTEHIHVVIGLTLIIFLLISMRWLPIVVDTLALLSLQFILCMYCQKRLADNKPANDYHLPFFFLIISLGGFVGGILTTWIIPLISDNLIELLFGLILLSVSFFSQRPKITFSPNLLRTLAYWLIFLILWFIVFSKYHFWGLLLLFTVTIFVFKEMASSRIATTIALIIFLCAYPLITTIIDKNALIYQARNFYGTYKIYDNKIIREMLHGSTVHGGQVDDPKYQPLPVTYYGLKTPIGEVMQNKNFAFKSLGMVGLGPGALMAYLNGGQKLDIYELDPLVEMIATRFFTYLTNNSGQVHLIFGDARINMKNNPQAIYDLLVVDAFSGDAIPTHLINLDVAQEYKKHLSPNGLIILHVSNRYIALENIVRQIGLQSGADVFYKTNPSIEGFLNFESNWMALTWDKEKAKILTDMHWHQITTPSRTRVWTDQYSSILEHTSLSGLIKNFKEWKVFYW